MEPSIEDKRFLPVGGDAEVQSDFQLIAGTNRDLSEELKAGRFREDLSSVSRESKAKPNDSYRLKKYLGRFGQGWEQLADNRA